MHRLSVESFPPRTTGIAYHYPYHSSGHAPSLPETIRDGIDHGLTRLRIKLISKRSGPGGVVATGIWPRWVRDEWEATGVPGKCAAATVFEMVVDFGMDLASQPGSNTRRQSRGLRRGSLGSARDSPEKTRPDCSIQTQYNDNRRGNRLNIIEMGEDARVWMMRWGWGVEERRRQKSRARENRKGKESKDWARRSRRWALIGPVEEGSYGSQNERVRETAGSPATPPSTPQTTVHA